METKKTLETGISDFKSIIENNCYFVDKTALIFDFFTHGSYISLMPRPKRFGKTLNLSMIEYFFDKQKANSEKLFSGLEISENKEFCEEHQNKYPVISISFKDVKENNWDDCKENFKELIFDLYEKFDFLATSDELKSTEKMKFEKILSRTASDVQYKFSLMNLSIFLRKHFKNKVIILVDEYDTPIINAFKNTPKPIKSSKGQTSYYEKVISFMQTFLGKAYKGNETNLRKGLITGVMRVARESIFSDWNNFTVYGITSNYFSDKFGFTQTETEEILNYFELSNHKNDIEKWYNGYRFGEIEKIYNPWSIVNYIANHKDGFRTYWVNSSDDSLIKERITEPDIKDKIQDLISGKTIFKTIRENFVFSDFEHNTELLWTLLFHNGFLTYANRTDRNQYELKIPNNELKYVFTDIILDWIKQAFNFNQDLLLITSKHLINNRIKEFERGFKEIISDTLSYFDIAPTKDKNKNVIIPEEQFYHVYTLGLLAVLSYDYAIKSNRESGNGRYDITLIPHDRTKNGVVIEIKSIEKQKETEDNEKFNKRIDKEIDNAIHQMERNKYYKELLAHKIPLEQIIKVPIVFAGKEPYITRSDDQKRSLEAS